MKNTTEFPSLRHYRPEIKRPEIFYHVTDESVLDSILKRGLRAADPGIGIKAVWLYEFLEDAIDFQGNFPNPVILKVTLSASWPLEDDPVVTGMGSYISRQ